MDSKNLTCLYVEDEPFLRGEITKFLKRRIKRIITAETGKEALEIFHEYPIDFIITDLKMPVMDGLEMAKEIRKTDPDIPIIITTALNDVELMQASIDIRVERYLFKPIDIKALTEALERVEDRLHKSLPHELAHEANAEVCKQLERKIEGEVARILKNTSGKGPQKVTAFMRSNLLEIVVSGSRTPLEQTLLGSEGNTRIVDYFRDTYYAQVKGEIEHAIGDITGVHVVWKGQKSDSERDVDIIKCILEP